MAYTTINKSSEHFNTKLYEGTGSQQSITGVGFQPDFTWVKHREDARSHGLVDAVRGATKYLKSDSTDAEGTYTEGLKSFDSDGFTLGTDQNIFNEGGGTNDYASWNWKANGLGVVPQVVIARSRTYRTICVS